MCECPYGASPKRARASTNCVSAPGCRNATRNPSRVWFFNRSISSCLNVGCNTTSERIFNAGSALSDITTIVARLASQCAPESIDPPNDSIALAICGAVIVSVPLIKSEPVMLAVPARSFGSTSAPLRTRTSAASKGRPGRSTTITRKPFANFVSFGWLNVVSCGAAAGGGASTPPIANADDPIAKIKRPAADITRKRFMALLPSSGSEAEPIPASSFPANTQRPPSSCR